MLSSGQFNKQVPRDLAGNLLFRLDVLRRANEDELFAAGIIEMCRQDILFFILVFGWCINPKLAASARVQPFIPWDFQESMLVGPGSITECIDKQRPGVCEKSRELGASWLFLLVEEWLCRFHEHTHVLNISRDEDTVDDGTPGSLFGKLSFIHERLPKWMGVVKEKRMLHRYPNGSVNVGEASTKYAGVSGRATMILLDEFSKVKDDVMMRGETAGTSDCRFFVSTHEGEHKEFFKITREPEFVKWTLHWTQHPLKNEGLYSYEKAPQDGSDAGLRYWRYNPLTHKIESIPGPFYNYGPDFEFVKDGTPVGGACPGIRSPWYDRECRRIGDSWLVAMELDIDAISSVKTLFEPILIRELQKNCIDARWEGDIEYGPDGECPRLVYRIGGPLSIWIGLQIGTIPPPDTYKIGADIGGGTGATPSCLSIGSATTRKKVAEYANPRIDPKELGTLIVAIGHLFADKNGSPAEVAWENRGPGVTCGTRLAELRYPARYRARAKVTFRPSLSSTYGWNPEGEAKPLMLREYKNALAKRLFENLSKIALEETLRFIYDKSGKIQHAGSLSMKDPSGARENHGDRATADGLCWLLINESRMFQDELPPEDAEPVYWHQTLQGRRDQAEKHERESSRWA